MCEPERVFIQTRRLQISCQVGKVAVMSLCYSPLCWDQNSPHSVNKEASRRYKHAQTCRARVLASGGLGRGDDRTKSEAPGQSVYAPLFSPLTRHLATFISALEHTLAQSQSS